MEPQVNREQFKSSFAPIIPILEDVIEDARSATSYERFAKAIPELTRPSNIARLSGTGRWGLAADSLVDRVPSFPKGFHLHSSESNHNQGKYIFGFPLGVFTFKREPHEENKGRYLQDTLELLKDVQQPLARDVEEFAGLKVYISIPPKETARVIVERPDASVPMTLLLDEFVVPGKVVAPRKSPVVPATVRSALPGNSTEEAGPHAK